MMMTHSVNAKDKNWFNIDGIFGSEREREENKNKEENPIVGNEKEWTRLNDWSKKI